MLHIATGWDPSFSRSGVVHLLSFAARPSRLKGVGVNNPSTVILLLGNDGQKRQLPEKTGLESYAILAFRKLQKKTLRIVFLTSSVKIQTLAKTRVQVRVNQP